jgi:O-glycosyl hydrolase
VAAASAGGALVGSAPGDALAEPVRDLPPGVLTLNARTDRPRQLIRNFGASDTWSMDPIGREWSREARERVADLLFTREVGIGLSLWRFNVGAGSVVTDQGTLWDPWRGVQCFRMAADGRYDWSRQSGQRWFLRAARERGVEQYLAGANSPPVWLTRNGHAYCEKAGVSSNLREGAEGDFARFLLDVVEHFGGEGTPLRYLTPLNEPNWGWEGGQEGCRYSNDDIHRLTEAFASEIARRGLATELILPDSGDIYSLVDDDRLRAWAGRAADQPAYDAGNNQLGLGKYREYIRDLVGDPAMREWLGGRISGHSYWSDNWEHALVDLRRVVRENLDAYLPDAEYWQTEYCIMENGRDLGMDSALRVARVIHHDLVDACASAWHWWLALSPADYRDGLLYTDYRATGEQNVLTSKTFWTLGNYSRFLRPGARRLTTEMPGAPEGLYASAYRVPAEATAVWVFTNTSQEERTLVPLLDGRPLRCTPHVTSADEDLAPRGACEPAQPVTVPARSVVTVVGRPAR